MSPVNLCLALSSYRRDTRYVGDNAAALKYALHTHANCKQFIYEKYKYTDTSQINDNKR